MKFVRSVCASAIVVAYCSMTASAAPTFVGPTAYQSEADIPSGFYALDTPLLLENFEDGLLDTTLTADNGFILTNIPNVDSVDGDDGTIDGSGTGGSSWHGPSGPSGVTFIFNTPTLPTAAGIVWTDGDGATTFEAFGPGMVSLGTTGPVNIADNFQTGTTAEDRFFGVQNPDGILAIKLSNSVGGIELDHVQYGLIPEPASAALLMLGGFCLLGRHKRRA